MKERRWIFFRSQIRALIDKKIETTSAYLSFIKSNINSRRLLYIFTSIATFYTTNRKICVTIIQFIFKLYRQVKLYKILDILNYSFILFLFAFSISGEIVRLCFLPKSMA